MMIILMQLPIQGTDFFYSNENIPLAPACLKAVAAGQGCRSVASALDALWKRPGDSTVSVGWQA